VALQAVTPRGGTPTATEMQQAIQIMNNRVNGAGVTEAQVEQQGKDIINVSVPGQSAEKVVNLVSRTAELLFRQVLLQAPNKSSAAPSPSPSPSASASPRPRQRPASSSASASPSPTPTSGANDLAAGHWRRRFGQRPGKGPWSKPDCSTGLAEGGRLRQRAATPR
jgi:preprotein translocase subunit SecD